RWSCLVAFVAFAAIRWFIRDSCKVDAFSQKHVFITGCDSGFGNLLARQLDGKGFKVIAACFTEKGAADLAAASSPRLKTLQLDVTDSASIRRAVEFDLAMGLLCSSDISKVTRCMEHALTARHPRTRYGAGWDAKLFWIPLSYLPSFVADFVANALLPSPRVE
uniref:Retinol dehydrogenase 1 n=1 Tax=Nothobranchius furzeri TaxID=105023 RepID=A0A8C6Q6A5_NOTFU